MFDDQLAGLDLREIEDVVHDRLHVLGAVAGEIEVATLGFVEPALIEQVEQAEKPGKTVRSSWLMFARNSLFAWLAASARERSCCNSTSAALRSLMSSAGPHHATGDIFQVDRLDRQGHQNGIPLRRCITTSSRITSPCQARRGFGRNALIGVHSRVKPARTETGHHFRLIAEDGRHLAVYRLDTTIFRIGGVDVGESDR